jgi:ribose transport system permease protein
VGALILAVLTTLLTLLQMPEGARRILFGLIVLAVSAAYLRITEDRSICTGLHLQANLAARRRWN